MKNISFLIKPASGRCNMSCRYCFYEDEKKSRATANYEMMSLETAALLIQQAMEEAEDVVSFAFQGGEPLLAGLDFFRAFVASVEKYRKPRISVSYSIQTNGTLVTQEWAEFFRDNRFLVGLSLDGTRELHDLNRIDSSGKGTYPNVLKAYYQLQDYGVETNILCVVTAQTAKKGQSVYQSLKKTGCRYLQFIPCLDPMDSPRGSMPYSLTPALYARFLKTVFDLWYWDWDAGNYVSVRLFEDYVHILCGRPASACATCGTCGRYLTLEGDGSVYPCDFFVLDDWRLGKLGETTLRELTDSEEGVRFRAKGQGFPPACMGCEWLRLCNGGCQRDWSDDGTRNYYCEALKEFFSYAMPRLMTIARAEIRAMR